MLKAKMFTTPAKMSNISHKSILIFFFEHVL